MEIRTFDKKRGSSFQGVNKTGNRFGATPSTGGTPGTRPGHPVSEGSIPGPRRPSMGGRGSWGQERQPHSRPHEGLQTAYNIGGDVPWGRNVVWVNFYVVKSKIKRSENRGGDSAVKSPGRSQPDNDKKNAYTTNQQIHHGDA